MHRYISQGALDFQGLREAHRDSAAQFLDIRVTAIGPDFVIADMPVDARTRQSFGLLHGGMSIVLAEQLGSVASTLLLTDEPNANAVGIEVSGSHLRSVRAGRVTGVCRVLKVGRTMHYWQIDITDERGRLVCNARLTIYVGRRDASRGG